jgi:hypothetical protein
MSNQDYYGSSGNNYPPQQQYGNQAPNYNQGYGQPSGYQQHHGGPTGYGQPSYSQGHEQHHQPPNYPEQKVRLLPNACLHQVQAHQLTSPLV